MNADDENHRTVLLGLEATTEVNRLYSLHAKAYRIPPMKAEIIVDKSFFVAQVTTALIHALHPAIPLFHYTIKLHYTLHIALASRWCNPEHSDCSSGEDSMKVARRLIKWVL